MALLTSSGMCERGRSTRASYVRGVAGEEGEGEEEEGEEGEGEECEGEEAGEEEGDGWWSGEAKAEACVLCEAPIHTISYRGVADAAAPANPLYICIRTCPHLKPGIKLCALVSTCTAVRIGWLCIYVCGARAAAVPPDGLKEPWTIRAQWIGRAEAVGG